MKTARFISLLGALALGLLLVRPASASLLQTLTASMSDPRPAVSNFHTFRFVTSTAGTYRNMTFTYCKEPTWGGACTIPTGLGLTGVSGTALTINDGLDGTWAIDTVGSNFYEIVSAGQVFASAGEQMDLKFNYITNPAISGCNATSNDSTGTCYIKIGIYSSASSGDGTLIDSGVASMTFVEQVTVTARVDPTFTFVVDGVPANQAHNGVTTSVSSSYNTLPFGALTAGVPKYAAHELTVTTNTNTGYTVSMKMVTQMVGVYAANDIDEFIPSAGIHNAWRSPIGNVSNTNTGWIGFNTSDNDVTNWDTTADESQFGAVSSAAETAIMYSAASDNGGSSDYVSYGIEANIYQPSDTYTGILYYNALPIY